MSNSRLSQILLYALSAWGHRQEPTACVLNYILLLLSLFVIVTVDVIIIVNILRTITTKEIILTGIYAIRVCLIDILHTYCL